MSEQDKIMDEVKENVKDAVDETKEAAQELKKEANKAVDKVKEEAGEAAASVKEAAEDIKESAVEFLKVDDNGEHISYDDDSFEEGVSSAKEKTKEVLQKGLSAAQEGFEKVKDSETIKNLSEKVSEVKDSEGFQHGVEVTKDSLSQAKEVVEDVTKKSVEYVKNNDSLRNAAVKVGSVVENVVESEQVQQVVEETKGLLKKGVSSIKDLFKKGDS